MKNIMRIFADDVRGATANPVAVLALVALCVAPCLLAWFGIAGSWDPYANTDQLKIAVANEDEGYTGEFVPGGLNFGEKVASRLHANSDYGWTRVGKDEAIAGVSAGDYYAAIVIPPDFSTKFMTALSTDVESAQVSYYANLKKNPVAPTFASGSEAQIQQGVRDVLDAAIDDASADAISDMSSIAESENVNGAITLLATRLTNVAMSLGATAEQVRTYSGLVKTVSGLTSSAVKSLGGTEADDVEGEAAGDASGDTEMARISESLGKAVSNLKEAVSGFQDYLDKNAGDSDSADLASETKALAENARSLEEAATTIADDVRGTADALSDTVEGLSGSTKSLTKQLSSVRKTLNKAAKSLDKTASEVEKLAGDIDAAVAAGDYSKLASLVGGGSGSVSQLLAVPVKVERQAVYAVAPYGSQQAPFYSIVALWAGAVMLAFALQARVSGARAAAMGETRGYRLYLGRFGLFSVMALLQAIAVWAGNVFFLHVQSEEPLILLVTFCACSLTFAAVAYAFSAVLGGAGRALCVLMLVVPVAGACGGFPAQMMAGPLQLLAPFSPFAYGVDAMRECIVAFSLGCYLESLVRLAAFFLAAIVLGLALYRPTASFADGRYE